MRPPGPGRSWSVLDRVHACLVARRASAPGDGPWAALAPTSPARLLVAVADVFDSAPFLDGLVPAAPRAWHEAVRADPLSSWWWDDPSPVQAA